MAVLAVLFAFFIGAVGTALIGFLFLMLGIVAAKAIGYQTYSHYVFMEGFAYFVSPGIGGFWAIYVTTHIFKKLPPATIYVSFTSIMGCLAVLTLSIDTYRVYQSIISIGDLCITIFQYIAIFVGAWLGKRSLKDQRESQEKFGAKI